MKRALVFAILAFIVLGARAESRVQIVDTDPAGEAALGRGEPFYLRIKFRLDQPLKIWAQPYYRDEPVIHARTNPSLVHTGTGYALGWFSLDGTGRVDQVRIKLGGGKPYREWYAETYPVRVTGTGQPAAQRSRPAWVGDMLAVEQERLRKESSQRMRQPGSAGATALTWGLMLVVLGLLVAGTAAPFWGVWKWRGVWRTAAAVPAVIMTVVIMRILIDTAVDPTSHNLWPFEILMWGGASAVAMGALALVRRLSRGT